MFTIVQKAVGYFSGTVVDSEIHSNKCERPSLEDFISVSDFEREKFEGVVTTVSERDIVVNDDIYFSIPISQLKYQFKVGDSVQGIAERKTKYEAWRAISLSQCHKEDAWDIDPVKLTGQPIPCRDLDAGIPGILKNDLFPTDGTKAKPVKKSTIQAKQSCEVQQEVQKTVIGKVNGIQGGALTDGVRVNDEFYCGLSTAEISFELCEGDWVLCKLATDFADNQPCDDSPVSGFITQVEPLRKKKIRGEVSHGYPTHFVINSEIFCDRKITKQIPLLRIGDAVDVEVIESDQEHLGWRALTVSRVNSRVTKELRLDFSQLRGCDREAETSSLFKDKHNIAISRSLRFPQVFLGSQSYLTVFVINNGEEACLLSRVYFVTSSQESQFCVLPETSNGEVNCSPIAIMPLKCLCIKFSCTGKLLGSCRQLCIFDFGDFRIGRYVTAKVEEKHVLNIGPKAPYNPQGTQKPTSIRPKDSRIVRGEKPFKAPAFLPVSLPAYPVPLHLWEAVESEDKVLEVAPFLTDPFEQENYRDKYSTLLHLEEVEMTLQMRQFDMPRAAFLTHGEFLSLAVPGLAEKRPSLMIGDTVIASSPCNIGGIEYEGYIHEVLHTQIQLKFHPTFHNQYRGEDYAVRFNFNRTPLRRCHFALQFSMRQLGSSVLFPTKLKFQLPQVCYVDPELCSLNVSRTTVDAHSKCSANWKTNSLMYELIGKKAEREKCSKSSEECNFPVETDRGKIKNPLLSAIESIGYPTVQSTGSESLSCVNNKLIEEDTSIVDCSVKRVDGNDRVGGNHGNVKCSADVIKRKDYENNSSTVNGRLKMTEERGKSDVGVKRNQEESFDDGRIKGGARKESSPGSARNVPRRDSGATPPRIPVVTRLFGIPSSGSSANSSICCSDDESKSHNEFESDVKVRKICEWRSPNSNGNGDGNAVKNFNVNDVNLRNHNPVAFGGADSAVRNISKKFSPNISKRNENGSSEGSACNSYQVIREEYQLDENTVSCSCKENPLACQEFHTDTKEATSDECVGNESVSKTPSYKKVKENSLKKCSNRDENGKSIKNENCKSTSCSTLQVEKQKSDTLAVRGKQSYCVPVLPLKSSVEEKMKGQQIPLLKWFNKMLNLEQKMAVRRILDGGTRPLPYVIYGPPGTGKTITVVEAILQIFTLVHHSRLLIVTPSNSAADLVTERLLTFDLLKKADLVRLNAYQRKEESIPENIRFYCCNGDQLPVYIHQRVIVTTATTAGLLYTLGLHNGHFTHVFVDEAGQLTEPECLVALGLVNSVSGQIVLAGDPQQLGPVVQSRLAKEFGLQESLLHRLCNSVLYQPEEITDCSSWVYEPRLLTLLVKNYRSHSDVINVPSKLFYHDSLVAYASSEVKEKLLSWSELPNPSCPLLFHGLVSENLQEGDSPSWFNPNEAFQVVRYTKSLISFGLGPESIGIITPYRKQVQKIRLLLTTFGVEDGVKVGTVEEFQGQERMAIIISTVRSSEQLLEVDVHHSLGFVKCQKRFNVAITRAQSLLIVVGNPLLLMLDNCWLSFISFCISKRAYRGPELQFEDQSDFD